MIKKKYTKTDTKTDIKTDTRIDTKTDTKTQKTKRPLDSDLKQIQAEKKFLSGLPFGGFP